MVDWTSSTCRPCKPVQMLPEPKTFSEIYPRGIFKAKSRLECGSLRASRISDVYLKIGASALEKRNTRNIADAQLNSVASIPNVTVGISRHNNFCLGNIIYNPWNGNFFRHLVANKAISARAGVGRVALRGLGRLGDHPFVFVSVSPLNVPCHISKQKMLGHQPPHPPALPKEAP